MNKNSALRAVDAGAEFLMCMLSKLLLKLHWSNPYSRYLTVDRIKTCAISCCQLYLLTYFQVKNGYSMIEFIAFTLTLGGIVQHSIVPQTLSKLMDNILLYLDYQQGIYLPSTR
jgi:hypothetical protein